MHGGRKDNYITNFTEWGVFIMNDIVNIILNNGVAIGVLIYFMYRDNKLITDLTTTVQKLTDTILSLKEMLTK